MKTSQIIGIVALVHLVAVVPVFLIQGCRTTPGSAGKDAVVVMPPSQTGPVRMPAPTSLKATPTVWPETSLYVVQSGDFLSVIARRLGVSVTELMAANGLTNPNMIRAGQSLIVPKKNMAPSSRVPTPIRDDRTAERTGEKYIVKSGDNLSKIAAAYGTSVAELKKINNLTGDKILVNQKLLLPGATVVHGASAPAVMPEISIKPEPEGILAPLSPAPTVTSPVAAVTEPRPAATPAFVRPHTVKQGETLKSIAMLYLINPERIKEFNGLTDVSLKEGQILKIPMVE